MAKKDGAFSLPRWKSCSLEEGDERNVIPLPACRATAKLWRPNCPDDQGGQDKDAEAYRGLGEYRAGALVAS